MMKLKMVFFSKRKSISGLCVCVVGRGIGVADLPQTFWRLLFVPFLHFDKAKLDRTRLMHLVMNL